MARAFPVGVPTEALKRRWPSIGTLTASTAAVQFGRTAPPPAMPAPTGCPFLAARPRGQLERAARARELHDERRDLALVRQRVVAPVGVDVVLGRDLREPAAAVIALYDDPSRRDRRALVAAAHAIDPAAGLHHE